MVTLKLKFQDVCAFVPEQDKVTVLFPEARRPLPVLGQACDLLPHYPYLRVREEDLDRVRGVQMNAGINGFNYWFFDPQLEFTLGDSDDDLTRDPDFEAFVVPLNSLYGSGSEYAEADFDLLGPMPPTHRLHSRMVIEHGRLGQVELCQVTAGDAEYVFESDTGAEPAGQPPKKLAHSVTLTVQVNSEVLLRARDLRSDGQDTIRIRDGENREIELTFGNSPLEGLAGVHSPNHSPRDFQIYNRLAALDDPEYRFYPKVTNAGGSEIGTGTGSCCECSKLDPPTGGN